MDSLKTRVPLIWVGELVLESPNNPFFNIRLLSEPTSIDLDLLQTYLPPLGVRHSMEKACISIPLLHPNLSRLLPLRDFFHQSSFFKLFLCSLSLLHLFGCQSPPTLLLIPIINMIKSQVFTGFHLPKDIFIPDFEDCFESLQFLS